MDTNRQVFFAQQNPYVLKQQRTFARHARYGLQVILDAGITNYSL